MYASKGMRAMKIQNIKETDHNIIIVVRVFRDLFKK